jgi:hypothetical protein
MSWDSKRVERVRDGTRVSVLRGLEVREPFNFSFNCQVMNKYLGKGNALK